MTQLVDKYLYKLSALIAFVLFSCALNATHNRAGEISYIQTSELSITATITTWTKASSQDVDRDSLIISWGDGTSSWLVRSNGDGELLADDIRAD